MPKDVLLEARVPGVTAQQYFHWLYATPDAFQRYHVVANGDDAASVGAWEEGSRAIAFKMTAVPDSIKRYVGANPITVTELQRVAWEPSGDAFTIESAPEMDMPMGSSFATVGHTRVQEAEDGDGVLVHQTVTCTCSLWGLASTIEGAMAEQARSQVQRFLDFCVEYCQQQRDAAQAAEAAVSAAALEPDTASPDAAALVHALGDESSEEGGSEEEDEALAEGTGVGAGAAGEAAFSAGWAERRDGDAKQRKRRKRGLEPLRVVVAGDASDVEEQFYDAEEGSASSASARSASSTASSAVGPAARSQGAQQAPAPRRGRGAAEAASAGVAVGSAQSEALVATLQRLAAAQERTNALLERLVETAAATRGLPSGPRMVLGRAGLQQGRAPQQGRRAAGTGPTSLLFVAAAAVTVASMATIVVMRKQQSGASWGDSVRASWVEAVQAVAKRM